ncbi:MAG: hypothetical protein HOA04_04435, partial [Euryarchaeota archaeon]|nr:hypothetical protein [Euryarchaeota archaeon]
ASAHRKEIWIPAGTTRVTATLDYTPLATSILCPTGANLRLALDSDRDGAYESPDVSGDQIEFVGGTDEGAWWGYDVQGNAIGTCLTPNPSTVGPRSPYNIQIEVWLAPGEVSMDLNQSRNWALSGAKTTTVSMDKIYFSHITSASNSNQGDSSSFFDWMATNWWLPTMFAIFFLIIMLGMNEQSRQAIQNWRENKKEDSPNIMEATIIEATTPPPLVETSRTSLLDTASRMRAEVKDIVLDAELI